MRTQLLVTVKNGSFCSKFFSLLWFVNIFTKSKINVWIDDPKSQPITLKASQTPYEIPVTPGEHVIYFDDPKRAGRVGLMKATTAATFGLIGASAGLAMGSGAGAIMGASAMAGGWRAQVKNNVLGCELNEGDELPVTVKPKWGKVKVKING